MTHVSLFTGIGGLDLAAEAAGFETVLQVEREPYALKILQKHWPDVPRITDVREVTLERVQEIMADSMCGRCNALDDETGNARKANGNRQANNAGISSSITGESNENTRSRPNITVVSGGFPCQPFSAAGKRRGADDDRYLWPELLRIVEELQPSWVIGENVSGLLSIDGGLEIDRMLAALEARDYTPWVLHYPAAGVGAPHKRDRVFIVAHSNGRGYDRTKKSEICATKDKQRLSNNTCNADEYSKYVADADKREWEAQRKDTGGSGGRDGKERQRRGLGSSGRWVTQSRMGGVATRLPDWMDGEPAGVPRVATGVKDRAARLKALGNAVVPAQAYPIFAAIAEVERDK